MKRIVVVIVSLIAAASVASAQELARSSTAPTVDGVAAAGEYLTWLERSDIRVGLSLSADGSTLYAAVDAPTAGWVAVGLGSLRMDGAYFVLAYVDAGGAFVSEETGYGRSHRPNADKRLKAQAVREANGRTTLEFAVPAVGLADGTSLESLFAYGRKDDRVSKHVRYVTFELPIAGR
ncbi:MAG TPA: DOMON domain-containing protein [Spirochaetia bacterium]|nr:hypothetical protein [Spirochaetaceae bacterium]HPE88722.1 DOMON domain-containing protein [Spirochaetales bacterium]HRW24875.1 DOMON domain-containing protein [Spirochaetia bacterium]